jgi:hypothetical protein
MTRRKGEITHDGDRHKRVAVAKTVKVSRMIAADLPRSATILSESRTWCGWFGSICLPYRWFFWGACGATMAIGRRVWGLDTALRIHLAAAPFIAFVVSAIHKWMAPEFDSVLRATAMAGTTIVLDAVVAAPLFERSYAMFRSSIGTWLPFAAIFLVSWVGGILMPL